MGGHESKPNPLSLLLLNSPPVSYQFRAFVSSQKSLLSPTGTDLRVDPGIERWATMRGRTIEHFRLTPKYVALGILTLGIIPTVWYYWGVKYQGMWDIQGLRKGESPRVKKDETHPH
ncbi:8523_t:CDS:2 [Paraglomus occultum]|uniref:NADH dehydrogenase [ubiquinone] 1 beta subcomplex subunit 4 n=1 Tax=Paraglomus occultum TaxID=144539 RepID=A0A9N8WBL9_9GLOM|nr:8523_t:CDS:2 [Paraglomus occultum]